VEAFSYCASLGAFVLAVLYIAYRLVDPLPPRQLAIAAGAAGSGYDNFARQYYAPGQGIEKIVRNEIFKEIWNEVDRLDQGVSATRFATARSSSAA
jgi:hypothetical protein